LKCEGRRKEKKDGKIKKRKERRGHAGFVVVTISKRSVLIETERMRMAVMVATSNC